MNEYIIIEGARVHNLKNIDVKIPRNKLTAVTGVSGSGKSSLAFDILCEEGKHHYISFLDSSSAIEADEKVNAIHHLSPTAGIKQNVARICNPRSTIATKTGLDALLAMLFCQYGENDVSDITLQIKSFQRYSPDGMCRECYGVGKKYIVDEAMLIGNGDKSLNRIMGEESTIYQALYLFCNNHNLSYKQSISSLSEAELQMYKYGDSQTNAFVGMIPWVINHYRKVSAQKGFNQSDYPFISYSACSHCGGSGRGDVALNTYINGKNIVEIEDMSIEDIYKFLSCNMDVHTKLVSEILERLSCFIELNLGYLSPSRSISSLSNGEAQRVFLTKYVFSDFESLIYIFDEPTIGLHETEKKRVISMLKRLVAQGNTVIVVEHDIEMIRSADYIIDIGPYAGKNGGTCLYQGPISGYDSCKASIVLNYYKNPSLQRLKVRDFSITSSPYISVKNCNLHNLKNISVNIPLGKLVGIAGVSGSGKSSLLSETIAPLLMNKLSSSFISDDLVTEKDEKLNDTTISGMDEIERCYLISQKPMGTNSLSCVATAIDIHKRIRNFFAKNSGLKSGMFSQSSIGGCPSCGGSGVISQRMGQTGSIDFICKACNGSGFIKEALDATVDGVNIQQLLNMEISQAIAYFEKRDRIIYNRLRHFDEYGLGYLRLGQKTVALSGGEAQRIKLLRTLCNENTDKKKIYILDEPTTGLSLYDIEKLLTLLESIIERGNTIVVSEHNLEFLSACDYIIELGPGGGCNGGKIIAEGSPKMLKESVDSIIGEYLLV